MQGEKDMQSINKQVDGKPCVSIVVPVYNTREVFFREAVESLLSQSYRDFELILVDNGSKPYIREIVEAYADARIRYHRIEENKGSAYARNYGIERACGEYIAFMDSDDISLPERLEKQVAYMREHPEVGCLGTAVQVIGENDAACTFNHLRTHHEIEAYLAFDGCAFCQSSLMLRRQLLSEHGIRYREEWVPAEDYGICVDLIGKTQFRILEDTLVQYRKYSGSTSFVHRTAQQEKGREIRRVAIELYCADMCPNTALLARFACGNALSKKDLAELPQLLRELLGQLEQRGCDAAEMMQIWRKRMKKNFYHTLSLRGQWNLLFSPVNQFFKLPFTWRLMCLITRGVF